MMQRAKVKPLPVLGYSAAGALMLAAMLYFAPRLPAIPEFSPPDSGVAFLRDSELSADSRDIISIYDYSPLFLVTRHNYAGFPGDLPLPSIPAGSAQDAPQSAMAAFREMYSIPDVSFDIMDGFLDSYKFSDFMNNAASAKMGPAQEPAARLSVLSSDTGETVFTKAFSPSSVPAGRMWTPVEMSLVVAPDASWSAPVPMTSSGFDALDAELEEFARKTLPEMRLRGGYYIITLSP